MSQPSRQRITQMDALTLASRLLLVGAANKDHNAWIKAPNDLLRVIVGSYPLREALGEKDKDTRLRISIPTYIEGKGFVPYDSYPMLEIYSREGDFISDTPIHQLEYSAANALYIELQDAIIGKLFQYHPTVIENKKREAKETV